MYCIYVYTVYKHVFIYVMDGCILVFSTKKTTTGIECLVSNCYMKTNTETCNIKHEKYKKYQNSLLVLVFVLIV